MNGRGALAALLLAALVPGSARAGDFVDSRITFLFTDEDVLHGAGETNPSSPSARIGGGRSSTLFFDNYETKYTGFETLSNLVLYKKNDSYFEHLETEAALAVTMLAVDGAYKFTDQSSYLRLNWRGAGWNDKESVSLIAFPVSADRFRLGYSYRLSWGGTPIFPRARGAVPGVKLQINKGIFYGFAGMKTGLILNELSNELETNYGWLAGGGVDLLETLRWEIGGGFFQRGVLPKTGVEGEPTVALGASTQLVFHVGQPVGTSVDFRLYKNDPELSQKFFQPESYPGGVSYTIAAEATYLAQTLQDPDALESTVRQAATAGDLQGRVKIDKLRLHATGSYRSLAFVLFNVPSLVPFQDFPGEADVTDELFVAAGADYYFEQLRFTPGVTGGVQFPAAITSEFAFESANPAEVQRGTRTVVVRDEGRFDILPADEEVEAILSLKGTGRWDLSDSFAAVAEVYYTYDPNRATIADNDPSGDMPVRVFQDPDQLGFNLLLQARF